MKKTLKSQALDVTEKVLEATDSKEKVKNVRRNLLKFDSKIKPSDAGSGGNSQAKNTIHINNLNINMESPANHESNFSSMKNKGKGGKKKSSPEEIKAKEDLTPSQSSSSYHTSDEEFEAETERKLKKMREVRRKSFQNGVNKVIDDLREDDKFTGGRKSIFQKIGGGLKFLGKGIKVGLAEVADFATLGLVNSNKSKYKEDSIEEEIKDEKSLKIDEIKKRNKKRLEESKNLKFVVNACDFIRLWLPSWMSNYSKRSLYQEVSFQPSSL